MCKLRDRTGAITVWPLVAGLCLNLASGVWGGDLEAGFSNPPPEARIRAYWWWLNGNVTREAITRDLEEMAAKGFGGALICDAGGADQRGNAQVPHGPTFFTAEWRGLYQHAVREADRLGLELSLNIQSGWNLGGPMIQPEQAPKKLVWSETRLRGPGPVRRLLDEPSHAREFYQDVHVVAYPTGVMDHNDIAAPRISASSAQDQHPAAGAVDGNPETYWVSRNTTPGNGPADHRPEWLQFDFHQPVTLHALDLQPRNGYGPRDGEIQVNDQGQWHTVKSFTLADGQSLEANFDPVESSRFRVLFSDAFDPRHPEAPRNVQVAEVRWSGPEYSVPAGRRPIHHWAEKALHKPLHFSAPETTLLMEELPAQRGEAVTASAQVIELTARMNVDGVLTWDVPAGEWEVLRFGCTLNDHSRVSTHSEGWAGYALDPFDARVFQSYWDTVVEPLIADAGPLAGKTLKYLHTDSWEVEVANWTPGLREQFRSRRGYDLVPFLPVMAGRIVDSRPVSNRFLNDFRRTMGDLAIDNHYRLFREGAQRHGMLIHPESGGPHAVPVDSLQCLGYNDLPMSEFWAWSWTHRIGDRNRFFVKQPASAAHTHGHNLVAAEGFTTIGPHWQERIWENLKPSFDKAIGEGLNRLVWHAFTCSPKEMGLPGQEYFAGTHFNPNSTWWEYSSPFLTYLNRVQFMMQRGLFVADALYYYGNHVPNFAQLKASDPAGVLPGYDYDVATEEVLLTRARAHDGRIVLPDGMSYRVLVLPEQERISLPVLRKVKELVHAGATVIGPKPTEAVSLEGYPACDDEVAQLADELWGDGVAPSGAGVGRNSTTPPLQRSVGRGRVISGLTARQVLLADGVPPDVEFLGLDTAQLDYLHRRDGETEIYFLANRSNVAARATCRFRVTGRAPELWNAVTGERMVAGAYQVANGRTALPLEFDPCGSWIVVFREEADRHPATALSNAPEFKVQQTLTGPWSVAFDPAWGGPGEVHFESLMDWTRRPEPGIRFYSGTAIYTKTFDLPPSAIRHPPSRMVLDLGQVRELAEVKVNGKACGIAWCPPFRVDISGAVQPGVNRLEVRVVNFWPNRVIGDAALPPDQRRTRTNIRQLKADTSLMESGLFGPVQVVEQKQPASGG
jgi:hypothetical protein